MNILEKIVHPPLESYIGLKRVSAAPLTQNKWRVANGLALDLTQDDINGYVIQYPDGYVSWSPAHVFEEAYKRSGEMSYPMALFSLLTDQDNAVVITRPIYEQRNEVIVLFSGAAIAYGINEFYGNPQAKPNPSTDGFFTFNIHTGKTAQWFPTQEDQLATDWVVTCLK